MKSLGTFHWKTHTPNLIREVLANPTTHILRIPLMIFSRTLYEVAQRAAELNDPKLNELMCRLTLYEQADPNSKDFIKPKRKGKKK